MAWKVLITARAYWESGTAARRLLLEAGCEEAPGPHYGPLAPDKLTEALQGCDAVIASSDVYNAPLFAACPQLKLVSRCGVGTDSVDMAAATAAGVVVTNTPGAMTDAVADYAFALLLGIARRLVESDALMRSGQWKECAGVLVCGKTLGLVGLGQIGRGVARRASGFGMRVLAYDPPLQAAGLAGSPDLQHVELTDLNTLLSESDFVSVHAPAGPDTHRMFNAERFARMKRSAYFINTSRGGLVDEDALIQALEKGQIAGAAIDVYRQEPLPADSPIRRAPHTLLSGHNAFNAVEAAAAMCLAAAENVVTLARRERPVNTCNPDVWTSAALRWPAG